MSITRLAAILLLLAAVSGCQSGDISSPVPAPAILDEEAVGYYDQMIVMDHSGPRAQVHLAGTPAPLWFSSVRDGLAYLKSPERPAPVVIAYVNDVGLSQGWDDMGAGNWIDAAKAYFVVGSDAAGGMGAPEFVPFGDEDKARSFALERGGEILKLADITAEMVLAPVETMQMTMPSMDSDGGGADEMQDMSSGRQDMSSRGGE